MTPILLEVCTGTYEAALAALRAGAQRIELCQALGAGGLTPSLGLLRAVLRLPIPRKHVLIRPRPGDFLYTPPSNRLWPTTSAPPAARAPTASSWVH